MSDSVALVYRVQVTGLDAAKAAAESASAGAEAARSALGGLQATGAQTLPLLASGLHTVNSMRMGVENLGRALSTLNPEAALHALLNMASVAANLSRVMRQLRETTATASAAQATLSVLSGGLWLVPLAIAAGALVYQSLRSMQAGGPVAETGAYLLHRGEYVVPANRVSYGPIYVTFDSPTGSRDAEGLLGELGPKIADRLRRGF
jgi:hypothetical protein